MRKKSVQQEEGAQDPLPKTEFWVERSSFYYKELDPVSFLKMEDLESVFHAMPLWFVESIRRYIRDSVSPAGWRNDNFPVFFINDWLRKSRIVPEEALDSGFVGLSIIVKDGIAGLERLMTLSECCRLLNVSTSAFSHIVRPLCPYYQFEDFRKPFYRHVDLVQTVYRLARS